MLDPRPGHQRGKRNQKPTGFAFLTLMSYGSAKNDNFFVEKIVKTEESNL